MASSSPSAPFPQVKERLQTTLGIQISSSWWNACCEFLSGPQSGTANRAVTVDAALTQVLHADLRDVVAGSTTTDNHNMTNHPSDNEQARRRLYQAIQASKTSSTKQQLSNAHLLCQLEDWVDMSLGKEAQLATSSSTTRSHNHNNNNDSINNSSSTQPRNPHRRCLKLFLTDGHKDDVASPIVAMEVSPIARNLQAGGKWLLNGSITIRRGILQLHAGNTIVVGGYVPQWVDKRQATLEEAQRKGGVGVDPTIRALIGTSAEEEEQPIDEGEGESGDVVDVVVPRAAPPPPPPVTTPTTLPPTHTTIMPPPITHPTMTSVTIPPPSSSMRRPLTAQPHPAAASNATTTAQTPSNITPTNRSQSTDTNSNPTGTNSNPYLAHSPVSTQSPTTPQVHPQPIPTNPYANLSSGNSSRPTTTTTMPTNLGGFQTAAGGNPLAASQNRTPAARTMSPPRSRNAAPPTKMTQPPSTFTTTTQNSTNIPSNTAPMRQQPHQTPVATPSTCAKIPFRELFRLLQQWVSNPAAHPMPQDVFVVDLMQKGGRMHFNIGKTKDPQQPKAKKYHFEIHATFGSPNDNDDGDDDHMSTTSSLLSCKLPSELIEPYFEKSPAELRALSRTDRALSNQLVEQGGQRVQQAFFGRQRTWNARVFLPIISHQDRVMALDNVQTPILILEPVEC